MPQESKEWAKAVREEELAEGERIAVEVGKDKVLVSRVDGELHACGGKCTHYGGPLEEGLLVGRTALCPWHGARFDVATGEMQMPPALNSLGCYAVKVEDGWIYVGPKQKPTEAELESDQRTFVIVGAGAAGNAAAETLRKEGFGGRIVMITAEADGPYDRPNLSKEYMAGEAPEEWMPLRSAEFYEENDIELLTEQRVSAVHPEARKVAFADGTEVAFDKALLATGGVPRALDAPGADLAGVFLLRSWQDARRIISALEGAERAVIVGAGFIGMEVAASLRERDLEVHLVAPEEVPMVRVFGERVGNWLRELHEEHGVHFHLGSTVEEFRGEDGLEEVALSDGAVLEADLAVIGIGIRPAVGYLEGTGLVEEGAVPVDETLRTKAEDLYAAGDIALVPDPRLGRPIRVEHWIVAERQGQHAARAMLGSDAPYEEAPIFWTMQHGTSLKYVGNAREWDDLVMRGSLAGGKFLAGYYRDGRLLAAAGAGMSREALAVAEILRAGGNVEPDRFCDLEVDLPSLIPGA